MTWTERTVVTFPSAAPTHQPNVHRVLLVDDDHAVLAMMNATLERKGFQVVAVATVAEALRLIVTESFDVLITDLHMPDAGDGFTVISAMRHSQPNALTLLVSGYPDVQSAMAAILLEADDIIVKPFEAGQLAEIVRNKLLTRKPALRTPKERVAAILERCVSRIVDEWLVRVKKNKELNHISLTDEERMGYLPKLIEDLIVRLRAPNTPGEENDSSHSAAALAHGQMRCQQGYTAGMLVHDSRILQVTLFGTLQSNLSVIDFSLLLPDVMTITDEVDSQLTQTTDSFLTATQRPAVA
jgi:DNA-binding response OmpR family regulator